MARTLQTARKSSGGKAPRKLFATLGTGATGASSDSDGNASGGGKPKKGT